jgi:hypothetical protein
MLRVKLSICTVVGPLHTGQITLGVSYALSRSPSLIRNGLLLRAVGCLYPTLSGQSTPRDEGLTSEAKRTLDMSP